MGHGGIRAKLSGLLSSQSDTALDMAVQGLDISGSIVSAAGVPIPGLSEALKFASELLKKIQEAKSNRKAFASLRVEMASLVKTLDAVVADVQARMETYPEGSPERIMIAKELRGSQKLTGRVSELKSTLQGLCDKATSLTHKSRLKLYLDSKSDAEIVNEIKETIATAHRNFQTQGEISIEVMVADVFTRFKTQEDEQILRRIPRAEDAHYRSAANAMKARLQTGTRERAFEVLEQWEQDQTAASRAAPICVLVGEAGTGKSTITSEFSKRLQERGHLGASFFFTRGVQELNSPRKFFSTVASQLADSQPALRDPVVQAAREHFKITTLQQLEHEFQDLIQKPLASLPPSHPPFFVVVDALDECTEEGPDLVPTLLRLFLSCATRPESPLRVFLTSRPEPHYIHNVFATPDLQPHIMTVSIQSFRDSVDSDISALIRARLGEEETSKSWMYAHPEIVTALVKRSDGLFIFARTAVDFLIGDPGDPEFQLQERYEDLMKSDGGVGLAALDKLYRTVLDSVSPRGDRHARSQERLKRVLEYLVALQAPEGISPRTLEALTGMRWQESVPILNKLRSVVFFERDDADAPFRIIHATFREFLSRYGVESYVNPGQVHACLAEDCIRTAQSFVSKHCSLGLPLLLRLLTEELPDVSSMPHVGYAAEYFSNHNRLGTSVLPQDPDGEAPSDSNVPPVVLIAQFARFKQHPYMWRMIHNTLVHMGESSPTRQQLTNVLLDIGAERQWNDELYWTSNTRDIQIHYLLIMCDIEAIGEKEEFGKPSNTLPMISDQQVEQLRDRLSEAERTSSYDAHLSIVQDAHIQFDEAIRAAGIAPNHRFENWGSIQDLWLIHH